MNPDFWRVLARAADAAAFLEPPLRESARYTPPNMTMNPKTPTRISWLETPIDQHANPDDADQRTQCEIAR